MTSILQRNCAHEYLLVWEPVQVSTGIQSAQSSVTTSANSGTQSTDALPFGLNSFAKMAKKNPATVAQIVPWGAEQSPQTPPKAQPSIPAESIPQPQAAPSPPVVQIPSTPIPEIAYIQPVTKNSPVVENPETSTTAQTVADAPQQQPAVPVTPEPHPSTSTSTKIKSLVKWLIIVLLTAQGLKGLFDSLYFILVEFQNFENALVDQLVETSLINQLILKASLLVFTTALSVFFGLQLSITKAKHLHWLKIIASVSVGVTCFFVLRHANTIHVLDILKQ